jgi:hypothetical protein
MSLLDFKYLMIKTSFYVTAVLTTYFYKGCDTFQACEHNTNGTECDYCLPGYYGDATRGTPVDCQQCACPLVESSNNFSPNCELKSAEISIADYICTDCPQGYDGDQCERYTKCFCTVKTLFLYM